VTNSQNGWPIEPAQRSPMTLFGVPFGDVRDGDVRTVLSYVATRFHQEVEHLVAGQCGAYNPRHIAGASFWSNHASATAIDINWGKHVQGVRGTFTAAQHTGVVNIVNACDGVVRWGGTYTGTVDEMHFEINVPPGSTRLAALAREIRTPSPQEDPDMDIADLKAGLVQLLQEVSDASLPAGSPLLNNADGTTRTTTQNGRNGLVYARRLLDNISPE
jgi:D-alanyl-D-alanine carboxypeptidase